MSDRQVTLPLYTSTTRWFIPLSRRTLLGVLASGLVRPASALSPDDPWQDEAGDGVVALPEQECARYVMARGREVGAGSFPVLLELSSSFDPGDAASGPAGSAATSAATVQASHAGAVLGGVIPVAAIEAVHFRTGNEQRDFVARAFENVPTEGIELRVSGHLFASAAVAEGPSGPLGFPVKSGRQGGGPGPGIEQVDRFAGALRMVLEVCPGDPGWLRDLGRLLGCDDDRDDDEHDGHGFLIAALATLRPRGPMPAAGNGPAPSEKDGPDVLYMAALKAVAAMAPGSGLRATTFLEAVRDSAASDGGTDGEKVRALDRWIDVCQKILDGRKEVRVLDDGGDLAKRAILLFLLRQDPPTMLGAAASSLAPGEHVLLLAAALSGARVGYEALPATLKGPAHFRVFSRLQARLANRSPRDGLPAFIVPDENQVRVEEAPSGKLGTSYDLRVEGVSMRQVTVEGDSALRKLDLTASEAGIVMHFDRESGELYHDMKLDDGATERVFVRNLRSHEGGSGAMVRLWAPSIGFPSDASRSRMLTKKVLVELLLRQASPELHCRIAISESDRAVVTLVDQLVETVDVKELLNHLRHVSEEARRLREQYAGNKGGTRRG